MLKPFIRLFSFFGKEVNEIRRQPRLVLSLMLGPFVILLLFGVGYTGERPQLQTTLVVPSNMDQALLEQVQQVISVNFELTDVTADWTIALEQLQTGQVDVVEILPEDIEERALSGERSPVAFKYNAINPLNEQWIQYLAYAQVNEINRAILLEVTRQLQDEAATIQQQLDQVYNQLGAIESGMSAAQRIETQQSLGQLRDTIGVLAANPLLLRQLNDPGMSEAETRQELDQLRSDLEDIEQALGGGSLEQQQTRIETTRRRVETLRNQIETFADLPPTVIISPLQRTFENLRGRSLDLMTYYAPSVLALIVQHIAVTLGALSLVRERLLGALELYRVAPVSILQILLGKYLGYTLFISLITGVLIGLMRWGLQIPFLGSPLAFIAVTLLFILAALGVGFLISVLSTSESQAVQLSMLVLLLSVFFSGFFLPLENFKNPIDLVGYGIPLTHGINAFQAILLRGWSPDNTTWLILGSITGVTFVIVLIISEIQFRRA
jgi:ABC-2 type transport system permease protein